jgi:hypothetical protein
MTELDTLLRESFSRLAVPADPAGVAERIQSRVDAGDLGTPPPKPGPGGPPFLAWIGIVLAAGLVGGLLGVLGVFGHPAASVSLSVLSVSNQLVPGLDCPGGSAAASFRPGERVLAVARSVDSSYLGLRDPADRSRTVWVATSAVVRDPHQSGVASLPVSGCPVPTVSLPTSRPTSKPTGSSSPSTTPSKPAPPTKPKPPAGDTTKPQIDSKAPNPATIYGYHPVQECSPGVSTIVVVATDNVGVTSVTASSSFSAAIITRSAVSGSVYTYTVKAPYASPNPDTHIPVTFTARDAAGNHASVSVSIILKGDQGCLG